MKARVSKILGYLLIGGIALLLCGRELAFSATRPAVQQPPAAPQGEPKQDDTAKPADAQPPRNLAALPAFDRVYLKGKKDPLLVQATLPRPFNPALFRRGETISLKQYRPDGADARGAIGVKVDDIVRIEFFEELLLQDGDKAMVRRDFGSAFDAYARLVKMNANWPGAKDKLFGVFYQQAEHVLSLDPPDYETAIGLCLQLRAEDRKAAGVQSLLRRACLGQADAAIRTGDFVSAREQLQLFLKHYPSDAEATRFQIERFASKAQALVEEAKNALGGNLEEQRKAVGILLSARHIWPATPDIDLMIDRARRNYPILQIAVFDPPGTFEPLGAETLSEWQSCRLIFDWLFEPDESGGQFLRGPMLAPGGWNQSALGLKHEFTLQRGLHWSDGKQVTAYDLEHSLKLWLDNRAENFDSERARFIGDIQVRSPFELSVDLKLPHARPLSLFALPLLPKHGVMEPPKRGDEYSRAPIGTGPFLIGKPDSAEQVKFVSNPEFRGSRYGQPFVKEINFQHYVKSSAAAVDLESHKAHLMTRLDPLETIRFSKLTGQFEVRSYLSNSVYWLGFNHRRPPLDDHRIRRAMLLAVDRQAILTQYFQAGSGGLAHRVITGPFPTHSPAYDTKVPVLGKDEALAKQLVEEARKENKLPSRVLTLKYPLGDSAVEKAVSQIKKDLQRIGLEVRTEAKIEADLRHEVLDAQDFDIVYWRYDHRNVLFNIAPLFDPDQRQPGGTNFMGYQNPELIKLLSHLRQEQRPFELWEIQREIHRFIHRENVFVPLWQLDNYIAYTSKLLYRQGGDDPDAPGAFEARQLPIHPLYLFRKTEGWFLEP